eukprot:TRINITY_DN627_c0_g1_i2.p1 TRINITY_DN627_c0_g1~~TRINITY_DN627_c0_g1_i2.p1  ORF type:complete len:147 (+),score=24.26 TRINITY_DN627_c0_g1_i2:798-1238(+)
MEVTRVYADPQGESHFSTFSIPLNESGAIGSLSESFPASSITFRSTPGDYHFDFHNAPRRQFIINLNSAVKVTTSDGESRIIESGQVLFVEDTFGKGHISQSVNGEKRNSVFIGVPDDFKPGETNHPKIEAPRKILPNDSEILSLK